MTAHGNDGPHQGVDCIKMGEADYIPKPFPIRGRTLDKAILEALDRSGQSGPKTTVASKPSGPPRAFDGGRMVLFNRRVEICGVDIPISQLMHQILTLLSVKRPNGQYVAYAGSDLMERLGKDCGQNGIASQVLEFRNKVAQRLLEEAHITCERTSIIASGGPGYRLQEWITLESGTGVAECKSDSLSDAGEAQSEEHAAQISGLNERQRWALSQLKKGVPTPDSAHHRPLRLLNCHCKTGPNIDEGTGNGQVRRHGSGRTLRTKEMTGVASSSNRAERISNARSHCRRTCGHTLSMSSRL